MYEFIDDMEKEPDECEYLVWELKNKLRESIKKEYTDTIDRLQKENAELQDVKERWDELKSELKNAMDEYEIKKRVLERNVRYERLSDLLESISDTYYAVINSNAVFVYEKKCNKCDEKRKITFYSPNGNRYTEDRACKRGYQEYRVTEAKMIRVQFSTIQHKFIPIIQFEHSIELGNDVLTVVECSDDKPFELVDKFHAVFKSEENAKKYAAYRTQLSRQKYLEKDNPSK